MVTPTVPGSTEAHPPKRSVRDFLLGPFLVAVTAAILVALDPLSIEEGTASLSEETVMRLSAHFYPPQDKPKSTVTVVLLDEQFMQRTTKSWPVSYAEQGKLLAELDHFGAKFVFLDLLYSIPHADPADLPEHLASALPAKPKTRFYFAARTTEQATCVEESPNHKPMSSDHAPILDPIAARFDTSLARLGFVEWQRCGQGYPLYLGGNREIRTPAYALFQDSQCDGKTSCDVDKRFDTPLVIRWGALSPEAQSRLDSASRCGNEYEAEARSGIGRFWHRVVAFSSEFAQSAVRAKNRYAAYPCPAVNVMSASAFLNPDSRSKDADALLRRLINDHFVFVGADILGSSDVVHSTVHGELPGVFMHAMAMDNLVRLDDRYLKEMPAWLMACVVPLFLILVAAVVYRLPLYKWRRRLAILGLVFMGTLAAHAAREHEFLLSLLVAAGGLLLFLIAPTAAARAFFAFMATCVLAVLAISFGWAPPDVVVIAVAGVLVGEKVYDDIHGEAEREFVKHRLLKIAERIKHRLTQGEST